MRNGLTIEAKLGIFSPLFYLNSPVKNEMVKEREQAAINNYYLGTTVQ